MRNLLDTDNLRKQLFRLNREQEANALLMFNNEKIGGNFMQFVGAILETVDERYMSTSSRDELLSLSAVELLASIQADIDTTGLSDDQIAYLDIFRTRVREIIVSLLDLYNPEF